MTHRAPKEPREHRFPWALVIGVVLALVTAGLVLAVLLLGR
jgi:hypothetical protein